MDKREFTRRGLLRTGATVAAVGTVGSSVAAAESSGDGVRPIPPVDLSGVQLDTTPVDGIPETADGIRPGSQLIIDGPFDTRACTANFVWRGDDETNYLGTAGHCLLPDGEAATKNAGGDFDLSKNKVTVKVCQDCTFGGQSSAVLGGETVKLGRVAYARQSRGNGNGIGNDFGLVEIPSDEQDRVDPSMPTFGGPTGSKKVEGGDPLCLYGAGTGTGEVFATQGRTGIGLGSDDESWDAGLPATPGDSGGPVQHCAPGVVGLQGEEAAGIVTHFGASATGGTSIAGTSIGRAKELAKEADIFDLQLVTPS